VTALGGPIYRSARLETLVAPLPKPGPSPGIRTQPLPAEVAGPFQAFTGFDVTGIPVHRGPAVSEQARAYQARAFTRAGEIFLPDEAGPIEHSDTRALLAHELTHAIQQRVLAPALPDEASAHGQELEAEANTAEQWFRSGGTTRPRLAHLPVTTLLAGYTGAASQVRRGQASTGRTLWSSSPTPDLGQAGPDSGQRQSGDLLPAPHGVTWTAQDGMPGAGQLGAPADDDALTPTTTPAVTAPGGSTATDDLAGLLRNADRLAELSAMHPADLDDPTSLDELTSKVYPRLRGLLRAELLVDRERAGLLADIHGGQT
jgi:hypothetical protein